MLTNRHSSRPTIAWLPLVLMLAALVLRVLTQHGILAGLPNLSPLMALAFTGAVVFPKSFPWWSWALLLLGVDLLSEGASWWTQADGHLEVLFAYGCYALAAWWGGRLRGKAGIVDTIAKSVLCSVIFYVVSNTVSWAVAPYYSKDISGWIQALTMGKADVHPTTLEFFRNSLTADVVGTVILLAVYNAEALLRKLRTMPLLSGSQFADPAVA